MGLVVDKMVLRQRFLCQLFSILICYPGACTIGDSMKELLLQYFFFCLVIAVLERDYVSYHILSFFCRVVYYLS